MTKAAKLVPVELKSTDGMRFYLTGKFAKDNLAYFWLYFIGSPQEVKNYAYTLSLTTKTGEKFTYYGHVKSLDEERHEIIVQKLGFAIGIEVIKRAMNEKKEFDMEVKIHALKEEAKDNDMESGVDEPE